MLTTECQEHLIRKGACLTIKKEITAAFMNVLQGSKVNSCNTINYKASMSPYQTKQSNGLSWHIHMYVYSNRHISVQELSTYVMSLPCTYKHKNKRSVAQQNQLWLFTLSILAYIKYKWVLFSIWCLSLHQTPTRKWIHWIGEYKNYIEIREPTRLKNTLHAHMKNSITLAKLKLSSKCSKLITWKK